MVNKGYCPHTGEYTNFELREGVSSLIDVSNLLCSNKRVVKGGIECLAQKEPIISFSRGKPVTKITYKPCQVYEELVRSSPSSPSCTKTTPPARNTDPGNNIDSYEDGYAGRLA